jgi:histidinol-phosphate aminotransferase
MTPYSPGLRVTEVRDRSGKETVLKLSSNEHPCGPFPSAIRAMEAVLPRLNRYPDGGVRALSGALCDHLGVSPDHLIVGNGSNEIIRLLGQALLRPADEVVFAWPSFIVYPMVTQMFGATAVRVPLDDEQVHDLKALAAAVTDRTRMLFLCNPNNPTGTIYRRAEFEEFLASVPEDLPIVLDEAYFEFVTDPEYPDGLRYFDGERPLVVLRTFSKIYSLAGTRIGYGVMPERLVAALHKVREPFNVNSVAQIGAYYSLADEAEVARRRLENQEQKTYLYSCFDRLGVSYVRSETNFVYFMTDKPVEVFEALLGQGVIARDFGTAPALRIGIGTPEDMRLVAGAFERVAEELGGI